MYPYMSERLRENVDFRLQSRRCCMFILYCRGFNLVGVVSVMASGAAGRHLSERTGIVRDHSWGTKILYFIMYRQARYSTQLIGSSLTSRVNVLIMFAPCIRSLARPASTRASQCLRRPRMEAIPKYTTPCRMQQKRFQSKPTFRTTAKALFKAHPYQLSLATIM